MQGNPKRVKITIPKTDFMKKIIIFLSLIIPGFCLVAQNINNFLGIYKITEVCTLTTMDYSDTIDYQIEIDESTVDSFDIQFYFSPHILDTIRASIQNDSTFQVPLQTFSSSYDSSLIYIQGEGYIINDSIKFNYKTGGSFGLFDCICKGVKKHGSGIKIVGVNTNFLLYPNPATSTLHISINHVRNQDQIMPVFIHDINGKLVMKELINYSEAASIDVSKLTPGSYILKIADGSEINYSGNFIKE